MSLEVGTGKAREVTSLLEAFAQGRNDVEFFCWYFMGRSLHPGQAKYMAESQATINALATANRWGKTTVLCGIHCHAGVYKTGAEDKYMNPDGTVDLDVFTKLKYETVHAAGEWEQAAFVWEDMLKVIGENARMAALVGEHPRSKPPYMRGFNGWKWMFRTLGTNASNIDGKSIYVLSIDEAGWVDSLSEMMSNVLRVRVADVRGRIHIVGTFKPGISRDFYKICVRASAHTGQRIDFAHGSEDEESGPGHLDAAIKKYLDGIGIDLDEYRDALERGING